MRRRAVAVGGPVAVAAGVAGLRELVTGTSGALVLVLVIVGVAAAGDRLAGVLAALASAAAFDFFLAVPYYRFTILARDDIETTVLLLLIGIAVTEISLWGRRHRARSRRVSGYLDDVALVARMAADGTPPEKVVATVETMIGALLDLDAIRYEAVPGVAVEARADRADRAGDPDGPDDPSVGRPVLRRDGSIDGRQNVLDAPRRGLPTMDDIELPAGRDGDDGRFLLTASTRLRRPTHEQLLVAVTLAEQVGRPRERASAPDVPGPR